MVQNIKVERAHKEGNKEKSKERTIVGKIAKF